jgi:hypothetical protein
MFEIIEGRWEDLISRRDLQGRYVRVIVFEEGEQGDADAWLRSLQAWVDSHEPVAQGVDDSREGVYSGTVDDPR